MNPKLLGRTTLSGLCAATVRRFPLLGISAGLSIGFCATPHSADCALVLALVYRPILHGLSASRCCVLAGTPHHTSKT